MTVLVTGSSGMLARSLIAHLKKNRPVLGVSRRASDGALACDLSDPSSAKKLFDAHPVDLVINAAAYSDVDGCERDPKLAYESNTLVPKNLSGLCSAKKIPWIHISTDYVFDGRKRAPYREEDAAGPVNIYGITKWLGEFYARNSSAACAVVRTSWLFGAPNPKNFVDAIAARLKTQDAVFALDDQTDSPTSVKDLCQALERIADFIGKFGGRKRWNETFHVCNRGQTTRLEMAGTIRDLLGRKQVRVEKADRKRIRDPLAALRPPYAVMSQERFEKTFGMTLRPWREALSEYIGTL